MPLPNAVSSRRVITAVTASPFSYFDSLIVRVPSTTDASISLLGRRVSALIVYNKKQQNVISPVDPKAF